MPPAPTSQFSLRIAAVDGDLGDAATAEEFAHELRAALADLDVTRIDPVPSGPAPEGTRGLEVLAVLSFLITAVQAGEALTKVVKTIRHVAARYAERRQRIQLTVEGVDVDLAKASDADVGRVVQRLLALPTAASTGVRSALVVANARYDDPSLAQLRSPGADAEALARVLGDPGIGGFAVNMLMDADERTIRRRVAEFFANRDRDDLLLLHFSCHGVKDARGRLHLAARDTDLSVLGATAVPASFINDLLAESQSRRVVLVLDCCYSGAFARGSQVRSGSDVQLADEFGAGSGRIVLTASSATEYAFEGGELTRSEAQPSAFTGALVRGLETGEADLDADGEISIDELYDFAYRTVRASTPGQAPMKWSFGVEGSLIVARSLRPAALPQAVQDDLASDRVVLRMEAVRSLAHLLRGGKASLRAAALSALIDVRDNDDSVQVRRGAAEALGGDAAAPVVTAPATAPAPEPVPAAPPPAPTPTPARAVVAPQLAAPVPPPVVSPPASEPAPAPPPRGPEPRRGPLVLGGVLTLVSLAFYIVGSLVAFGPGNISGFSVLNFVIEGAAAGLLLGTRHPRWAYLMVGLLAWEWLTGLDFLQPKFRSDIDGWGYLLLGSMTGATALLCLVISLWRRPRRTWATRGRWVLAVVLAIVGFFASGFVLTLLFVADSLDPGFATPLQILASILCGLALPGVLLTRPTPSATVFATVGWLATGVQLAAIATAGRDEYNADDTVWMWVLVLATAALAIIAAVVPGRRSHDQNMN
jgi:hypothetical protein